MSKLIKVLVLLVVVLGAAALVAASYYYGPVIGANQRGVVVSGGGDGAKGECKVLGPGKHYWFISGYNPITSALTVVDVSEKELHLADPEGGGPGLALNTKDGDTIRVEFAAWYHVIPAKACVCVSSLGTGGYGKLVSKLIVTTAKAQAAMAESLDFMDGKKQENFVDAVRTEVNHQLADRGLELTVFKCNKFHFSQALKQKIEEIKKAQAQIEVNQVKLEAAKVKAREMEELAKGHKLVALQEAEARKQSTIMESEAQIIAAQNWVKAETIKAEIILVRSKIKAQALQVEAEASEVFAGSEGERFLRYRIADSLADAWAQKSSLNPSGDGLGDVTTGLKELSTPATGGQGTPQE